MKYDHPPRRQILAGGGSAAATGMQMSCRQNRSAALSAEPEVDQILSWFSAEGGIDSGVVAKLWDGLTWHRPVMEKRRAFEVEDPWWGFIAGGYVPELHKATLNDHFGLRQRITVCYGEPPWRPSTLASIRAACTALPVSTGKPHMFVAHLLWPLFRSSIVDGPIVRKPPDGEGGSFNVVERNFDAHCDMQEEAFLKPGRHDEAKHHGKMWCKFDRMALALHAAGLIALLSYVLVPRALRARLQSPGSKNWID